MAKYFYDKYRTAMSADIDWYFDADYSPSGRLDGSDNGSTVFETYVIDNSTDSFEYLNPIKMRDTKEGETYYFRDHGFGSKTIERREITRIWDNGGIWGRDMSVYRGILTYSKKVRDTYVSLTTAQIGTYPEDGPHTDGYWYVRQSAKSPSEPTSLTLSKTSSLRVGETITVSWSGASDPEGELTNHYLELKRNGGSWLSVTTKNISSGSSSYSYTIPAGTTSIQFRVRVKDAQNLYSSYRESSSYTVINNVPPTISGTDRSLGDYSLPFSINFTVNDANPNDKISVRVTLNNVKITEINNAPRNQKIMVDITKQLFDPLAVNSTNTIQIRADDGNGGVAYRTLKFKKTNSAPVISGNDTDLGIIEISPTYTYSVSDVEDDAITIVERINDIIIRKFAAEPHKDYTLTIPYEVWLQFNPENRYTILIEATDERGAKSVRSITFKRKTMESVITLKKPFETDTYARRILLNPTVEIPDGAVFKVEACNNAYDEKPIWEDITEKALEGKGYTFTNKEKTADKWGVGLRIMMDRGSSSSPIILDGFGGAYD